MTTPFSFQIILLRPAHEKDQYVRKIGIQKQHYRKGKENPHVNAVCHVMQNHLSARLPCQRDKLKVSSLDDKHDKTHDLERNKNSDP